MNAELLLTHYERIGDAPDSVAKLRRLVLDLAVRGRVVEQDPSDGSASDALSRIPATDVGTRERTNGRLTPSPPTPVRNVPFAIPYNWEWVRFSTIADFSAGRTPARHDSSFWNTGDYPWVSIADMVDGELLTATKETVSELAKVHVFKAGPALPGTMIMSFKLTIGKIARLAVSAYHNEAIIRIKPKLPEFDPYLFKVLPLFARQGNTKGAIKGATLNRESISNILISLPPIAEQRRIVKKVDELMALCDQLEAARTERETTRDRLTEASLARLNVPNAETLPADARFALDALPSLTDRVDQVKQLRQAILNLAVRGKLVEQELGHEPAHDLLRRIAEELAGCAATKGRGKAKDLPPIDLADAPFVLPAGWAWARFPELGRFARGKSKHRPRNDPALYAGGTYSMVQTGDVARSGGKVTTYTSKYNDLGLAQSLLWPRGTLCITIAANIADSGILSFDACFPDSVVGFVPASPFENARYFEYFMRTAKSTLLDFAPATAQKNINLEILSSVLIPLPPLVEQHRIVAKVDELMALCDQLESSLLTADDTRRRLLDALLAEALQPALQAAA